jgi:hypothetical protein
LSQQHRCAGVRYQVGGLKAEDFPRILFEMEVTGTTITSSFGFTSTRACACKKALVKENFV